MKAIQRYEDRGASLPACPLRQPLGSSTRSTRCPRPQHHRPRVGRGAGEQYEYTAEAVKNILTDLNSGTLPLRIRVNERT
jgi:hypothetical protein